ncbi:MAG: hypothetical protein QOD66_2000 [Solirubrobacteraceae bacterium]|nr:hypothetical protein [Solirubrobacteraceae bacterium]
MPRRASLATGCTLFVLAAALAGCGNSRTPVPSLGSQAAAGTLRWLHYPAYGLSIRGPSTWLNRDGPAPLVTTFSLSDSVAALWSYPRRTPPPSRASALAAARTNLVAAARRKDPSLRLIRARVFTLGGYPAIELDAFEQLMGSPRRVRSTHVFTGTSEVVLDEYAPIGIFHSVDHSVFSPLKRSLRLTSAASG